MTVDEALPWLKKHRNELLESIRNGKYKPSPVRRVEIPKDNGGVRKLGIPTVIDRVIQQAIAQVLIPIYEPKFSDGSYGYRPHKSAKDAILKVKEYADEGYKYAVCLDLSKKAKDKLRKLTSRSQGRWLDTVLYNIKVFMRGWLNYCGIAEMGTLMKQ